MIVIRTLISRIIWQLAGFVPVEPRLFVEAGLFDFGVAATMLPGRVFVNLWIDRDLEPVWTAQLYIPLPHWLTYAVISRRTRDTRISLLPASDGSHPAWFYGAYEEIIGENGERFYCRDTVSNALPGKTVIVDSRGISRVADCQIGGKRI